MTFHEDDEGNLILDEDGQPIPKSICLCSAFEPNECMCGAWDDAASWWYDDDGI